MLSVPWLNDVRPIDLQFVQGRSLGEKAMNLFTTDMNERGKRDLANMVASAQKETALVLIQGAYCLVLPDKRVILWRFHNVPGSRVVLKWTRDLTSQAPNVPPIGL